jgi:hypothetical protein
MSKINSEFILGSMIGYFFSNSFFVFTLGIATGVVIQEKFGSVYKFTEFCYDSSKEIVKKNLSKVTQKFNKDKKDNIARNVVISDILDKSNNSTSELDSNEDSNDDNTDSNVFLNVNSLKNKQE